MQPEEDRKKNEEKQKKMLDTFGSTNIGAMGIPETEKKEKEIEKTFKEITAEHFPNLMKNITHQSSMNSPQVV